MIANEMKNYIYECKRTGLDDGQIAAKLGMTAQAYLNMVDGKETPVEKPVVKEEKKKPAPKAREAKPVSGVNYIQEDAKKANEIKDAPAEDTSWMED